MPSAPRLGLLLGFGFGFGLGWWLLLLQSLRTAPLEAMAAEIALHGAAAFVCAGSFCEAKEDAKGAVCTYSSRFGWSSEGKAEP